MLIPPPEADLSESLLVCGADILEFLQNDDEFVVEKVMLNFMKRHPKSGPSDFMDSLSLLYVLGLVDYANFRVKRRQHP